jgi:hypothetical protein
MERCVFVYKKSNKGNRAGDRCFKLTNNLYCQKHRNHYKAELFQTPGLMILYEATHHKEDKIEQLINF